MFKIGDRVTKVLGGIQKDQSGVVTGIRIHHDGPRIEVLFDNINKRYVFFARKFVPEEPKDDYGVDE